MEVEKFASKGVGGAGLGLGIAGTALGLLNGGAGNLLGGWLGNGNWRNNGNCCGTDAATAAMLTAAAMSGAGNCHHECSENVPVNRYELGLQQQLAAKESENSLLKSNIYTDQKLVEVYTALDRQIAALAGEVRTNKDEQQAVNMQQAVYNGTNTATIGCIRNEIAQLMGLTKLVVPNTSICPGWGNITVTPATTTTAPAAGA